MGVLSSWEDFSPSPSYLWDIRVDKKRSAHPQSQHKNIRKPPWLCAQHKPALLASRRASLYGVQVHLATLDNAPQQKLGMGELHGSSSASLIDQLQSSCKEGHLDKAFNVLLLMDKHDIAFSENLFCFLMKACSKRKALIQAKLVHVHLAQHGLDSSIYFGEYLINTLVKCGSLEDAFQVFQKLPCRTVFSWTAMISAYVDHGKAQEALNLHRCMHEEGVEPNEYTFVSLLKACGSIHNLEKGKALHADAKRAGFSSNAFVISTLVSMYGKCGAVAESEDVFSEIYQPDVVTWNVMLAIYAEQDGAKALQFYKKMGNEGVSMNEATFVAALLACCKLAEKEQAVVVKGQLIKVMSLQCGQAVHADAWSKGFSSDLVVGNNLLSMYGKCGNIGEAENVFLGLSQRDVVSWTAMLSAYVEGGQEEKAILLYRQMQEEAVHPDGKTFVIALQACWALADNEDALALEGHSIKAMSLDIGHALHAEVRRKGLGADVFIVNTLVIMYGKCGCICEAENVFRTLSQPDTVSCNAMLSAYLRTGEGKTILQFYQQMLEKGKSPNEWTFPTILQACCMLAEKEETIVMEGHWSKMISLRIGQVLHTDTQKNGLDSNVFVGIALVSMYGKCGSSAEAEKVFSGLSHSGVVSWTAMLSAYAEQGEADKALKMYRQMKEEGVSPNERTFLIAFQACCTLAEKEEATVVEGDHFTKVMALKIGHAFHADARREGFDSDIFVGSVLVSMYSKCGRLVEAENAFCELSQPNIVSWNLMLSAYVELDKAKKALQLYNLMQEEGAISDEWTFLIALQACCVLAEKEEAVGMQEQWTKVMPLEIGRALHVEVWRKGLDSCISIGNTLVSMYGKCGSILEAENVFCRLPQLHIDSWNGMLLAYVDHGQGEKALQLFSRMQGEGAILDETTLVCILQACRETGSVEICRQIHSIIASYGNDMSLLLATTLLHAYGSCASMMDAQAVFDLLPEHDVVSWSALIAGYARQGKSKESLRWYKKMQRAGVIPNKVTFLSLLSACSHAGLVDEGIEYFKSMGRDYGISPDMDHTVSVIDLLGRAGDFSKVEDMFARLPMQPDVAIWLCLLGACQRHGNVELGERAFRQALQLQPKQDAAYVLMSNIYVAAGLWDSAKQVDNSRRRLCVEAV